MFLTIFIAILSIIALMVIHEFGHFIIAKKFKVKVEEFGVGLPPRLISKKIGETVYSLNLIPFGAFVKVHGEEGGVENAYSFSEKPIWQRALIVAGGVISFWLVAIILLTLVAGVWGISMVVDDNQTGLINPEIQIVGIAKNSPAQEAGIMQGDIIIGFEKIGDFQEFVEENKDKEINLSLNRYGNIFEVKEIIPRISYPEGEGSLGLGLVRVAKKVYPWYQAPLVGIKSTGFLAINIIDGWRMGLNHLFRIERLPEDLEMEVIGPVKMVNLIGSYFNMGMADFLSFIALISVALALINFFPIPALDGGKLLFLALEKIKGSPINPKIEQKITAVFFALLLALMVVVTIKDIISFF